MKEQAYLSYLRELTPNIPVLLIRFEFHMAMQVIKTGAQRPRGQQGDQPGDELQTCQALPGSGPHACRVACHA